MAEAEVAVFWVVQVMRQWSSLEVLGLPLNAHQTPGCVGFLPVFDTLEAAKTWRDEHRPNAGIVACAPGSKSAPEQLAPLLGPTEEEGR